MLSKDRQEVYDQIKHRLENDLNNIQDFHCCSDNDNDWYDSQWSGSNNMSVPHSAVGWPPELVPYIRRVALMMAYEILNAVHTEQELEEKAENILLDNDENNQ